MSFRTAVKIMLALLSSAALADSSAPAPLPVCDLLTAVDIGPIGYNITGQPRSNSMDMKAAQTGAPTDIHSDICFYYTDKEGGRKSISLAADQFADMNGVAPWLQSKSDAAKDDKTLLSVIDDTVCEEGEYAYTQSKSEPKLPQLTQHYVACDRLVGSRRISLSVEMPGERAGLPSALSTKALLDVVIGRLPQPAKSAASR